MSRPPKQPLIVRTFMTHDMKDSDVEALATGRDKEFNRIMGAIARSRKASPGGLQHIVLYGSRGFGKSFMTRHVQVAVSKLDYKLGHIKYLLLPEEQHNLQRSPHAFLDAISVKLTDMEGDGGFGAALFQWPRPGEEAKLWDEAAARLEDAIDAVLPDGKGLVVAVIENFDVLLATLFKDDEDEQRLRLWLDRIKNRVMILATATGTVDIDYERPLFKAFETVRLSPWTADDCISYFNRQRIYEGRPQLTKNQSAKAHAIAEFIGGTPRLAQLLSEVLDTQDALTVAETMSALADKLAEYYRRRIEDLPPLGRGLLDALVRGGEPASQTELARRVGAQGQSTIARAMSDLIRADIVRGRKAPKGRATLYSVTDRVFVHYYRLRQGSRSAQDTPLTTILEFLKSFYSLDEQRFQALKYLNTGQSAEAVLFSRLALNGEDFKNDIFAQGFPSRFKRYFSVAKTEIIGADSASILEILEAAPEEVYEICRKTDTSGPSEVVIVSLIKAQALHRLGHTDQTFQLLVHTFESIKDDIIAEAIIGMELIYYLGIVRDDHLRMFQIGVELKTTLVKALPIELMQIMAKIVFLSLSHYSRFEEAEDSAKRVQRFAKAAGDEILEMAALEQLISSASYFGRDERALKIAKRAVKIAEKSGNMEFELSFLNKISESFRSLENYAESLKTARRLVKLAKQSGEKIIEIDSLNIVASNLIDLAKYDEAAETIETAINFAREAGNTNLEVKMLSRMAINSYNFNLSDSGSKFAYRAVHLAEESGNDFLKVQAQVSLALNSTYNEKFDEARPASVKALELARAIGNFDALSLASTVAIILAEHLPTPGIVGVFSEWLNASRNIDKFEQFSDPVLIMNKLFVSVARARSFGEFDGMLENYGDALASTIKKIEFSQEDGEVFARIASAEGRAIAYEAAAGILPRIANFMEKLSPNKRDDTWLPDMMSGFASACTDAGLLRDIAMLLTDDLAPQAKQSAALLNALADVDSAEVAEDTLILLDPDIATLIRRIRGLSDPAKHSSNQHVRSGAKGTK